MLEILEGFSKRMEFIAIVDSITNRKNKSEKIESLFEENQMENLILSTLVYIMETTLTEEEECTIENITGFIKMIVKQYTKKSIDTKELSRYIVKDILQNKGQNRYYTIEDYSTKSNKKVPIRLISDKLNNENKVIYELTKQGYDFLFRTKEVDDELGFQLEEIKLKMLIQKKNYKKSISTSRDLIMKLREKQIKLRQFTDNLRNNINLISGEMYDELVNDMYNLLEDEYKEMEQIDFLINESLNRIKEEEQMIGNLDEKSKNAKKDIYTISKNVKTALDMQIELLTSCKKVKKIYMETLEESMEYSIVKTYNFKEEILDNFEKLEIKNALETYAKLLRPLFMPRMKKYLNINTIYDVQTKINNEGEEEYSIEEDIIQAEQNIKERIERRNKTHIEIIRRLFEFSEHHQEFDFKQFFNSITDNELRNNMLDEKLIFMQMLKLYDLKEINIDEWKKEEADTSIESNGEFDLAYCLKNISNDNPDFYNVRSIYIEKLDDIFEMKKFINDEEKDIKMTNLKFKVIKEGD